MLGWMVLATVAAGAGGSDAAFRDWRQCIGETTRVAAQAGRVPEDMPSVLDGACPDQRAAYLANGKNGKAGDPGRLNAVLGDYLRRYSFFYTTGLWPSR